MRDHPLKRGLIAFGAVFGFLAGAISLWALLAEALWLFWLVIGASAVVALAFVAFLALRPKIKDFIALAKLGRDHPRVLRAAGLWEVEARALREQVNQLERDLDMAKELGVPEGRRRFLGEYLASESRAEFALEAVGVQDDELYLAASVRSGSVPEPGSIFLLRVAVLQHEKALMIVVSVEGDKAILKLHAVRDAVSCDARKAAAKLGPTVPPGLELTYRSINSLLDLLDER